MSIGDSKKDKILLAALHLIDVLSSKEQNVHKYNNTFF